MEQYLLQNTPLALSVPVYGDITAKGVMKLFMRNRKAFTLAETLITLTIIGVIAAVTIPTLVTNYQKHTYVTGLKKAYSQLQNVMRMLPESEGCSTGDYYCALQRTNENLIPIERLTKHLKVVKITTRDNDENCKNFTPSYNYENCYYTADGMQYTSSHGALPGIVVDVNGAKKPNKIGRDRFCFVVAAYDSTNKADYLLNYGGVPYGTLMPFGSKIHQKYTNGSYHWKSSTQEFCSNTTVNASYNYNAQTCTGRVLEENAMNY